MPLIHNLSTHHTNVVAVNF